jgi:hypothetical protein
MARGTALSQLLRKLRAESGHALQDSLTRATQESYQLILARVQETLYADHDWPFMRVTRDVMLEAGARYYDFPSDLNLERLERVEVKWGGRWLPVQPVIDSEHYNVFDSDADVRSDPVRRWAFYTEGDAHQLEVWPVPATNGNPASKEMHVRLTGIKKLGPLVSLEDRADLDDQLIVLYAAAEVLAEQNSPRSQAALASAQTLYRRLKSTTAHREPISWLGDPDPDKSNPPRITVVVGS